MAAVETRLNPSLDQSGVFKSARRIVVKVGSSLVTNEGRGLDEEAIGQWSEQLAALVQQGLELIMVSSGAVAEGMKRLGWSERPKEINELQAAAAVGQMGLVQMYETQLRACGVGSAQRSFCASEPLLMMAPPASPMDTPIAVTSPWAWRHSRTRSVPRWPALPCRPSASGGWRSARRQSPA